MNATVQMDIVPGYREWRMQRWNPKRSTGRALIDGNGGVAGLK